MLSDGPKTLICYCLSGTRSTEARRTGPAAGAAAAKAPPQGTETGMGFGMVSAAARARRAVSAKNAKVRAPPARHELGHRTRNWAGGGGGPKRARRASAD